MLVRSADDTIWAVSDKADGLHRSVHEIKTNQSSQSLNEAGSLTKVARFFFGSFEM